MTNEAPDSDASAPAADEGPSGNGGRSAARLTPAMKRVLWAAGCLALIGLVAAAWFAVSGGIPGAASPEASSTAQSTPGPIPGASPTSGSEVQPPDVAPSEPDRIPDLAPTEPLVSAPLPDSGSATGELVDGFPSTAMGPASGSEVVSSAIATEGDAMQVTLVARTDDAASVVAAHFRTLWSESGLVEQSSTDPDVITYAGRQATVTLAFSGDSATGTVYNVLGSFRTR